MSKQKKIVFISLSILIVAALLLYVATNNVSQYFQQQTALATASVNNTDSLIQLHLKDLRKDVGFFVESHEIEIQNLANNTEDYSLRDRFNKLLTNHFPNSETYTLANSDGGVILSDLEGLVGAGCRENIRVFAIDSQQSDAQLRIHHHKKLFPHFDIMHEMHSSDGQIIIFFITFKPTTIKKYITNLQLEGHQLMLIKQNSDFSIELTEIGSKKQIEREHKLSMPEQDRILAKKDIPDTLWQLVDIIDEKTIKQAKFDIYRDFGAIFVAFLLGILLVLATSRRKGDSSK